MNKTYEQLVEKCFEEEEKYAGGLNSVAPTIGEIFFRIEELEERLAKAEQTIVMLSADVWI